MRLAFVVADRQRRVELAVGEQPRVVEVVLLLLAGGRGEGVEPAERVGVHAVAGRHPAVRAELGDGLRGLVAEAAVVLVAEQRVAEVEERRLDRLDGGGRVALRQGRAAVGDLGRRFWPANRGLLSV